MSLGFYKFVTVAGGLLNLSNTGINIKQRKEINSIKEKLSYIRDDISWIESNEINQLLSNQAALRVEYEKNLAELFSNKQLSLELDNAISALSTSTSFNDPKVYNIILAYIDNINLLLTSTSETLVQMFDINEATLDKVLDLISEINSIKLRFNLDNADLQLRISDNSRLIIKLSEQQLSYQLSTLQSFESLRSDLELINAQVDKKMADFGVLSTNTTGIILSDGTFKLSDTLDLVTTEVFDITFSEVVNNSSTSIHRYAPESDSSLYTPAVTVPYVNYYHKYVGGEISQCHATTSCNQINLLTSRLIKKFNDINHTGHGLLLNRPYKLLISDINPQREMFVFLKGAGLSDFDSNGLSVEFIPALLRSKNINRKPYGGGTLNIYSVGEPVIKNVTWGIPGSYKIPSSTQHVKFGPIFTSSVIQKSDELIVIKIKIASNYSSVISGGSMTGAVVSGSGVPGQRAIGIVDGHSFVMPNSGDILAGGSFILNLPINHLSFSGIECAQ